MSWRNRPGKGQGITGQVLPRDSRYAMPAAPKPRRTILPWIYHFSLKWWIWGVPAVATLIGFATYFFVPKQFRVVSQVPESVIEGTAWGSGLARVLGSGFVLLANIIQAGWTSMYQLHPLVLRLLDPMAVQVDALRQTYGLIVAAVLAGFIVYIGWRIKQDGAMYRREFWMLVLAVSLVAFIGWPAAGGTAADWLVKLPPKAGLTAMHGDLATRPDCLKLPGRNKLPDRQSQDIACAQHIQAGNTAAYVKTAREKKIDGVQAIFNWGAGSSHAGGHAPTGGFLAIYVMTSAAVVLVIGLWLVWVLLMVVHSFARPDQRMYFRAWVGWVALIIVGLMAVSGFMATICYVWGGMFESWLLGLVPWSTWLQSAFWSLMSVLAFILFCHHYWPEATWAGLTSPKYLFRGMHSMAVNAKSRRRGKLAFQASGSNPSQLPPHSSDFLRKR